MKHNTTIRQYVARGLFWTFFAPVGAAVQLLAIHPTPKWIDAYGKVFEWIAGGEGKLFKQS